MENEMNQKIKILLGATGIEILFRLRCTKARAGTGDCPSDVSCQSGVYTYIYHRLSEYVIGRFRSDSIKGPFSCPSV
jgi:hypothetical protein